MHHRSLRRALLLCLLATLLSTSAADARTVGVRKPVAHPASTYAVDSSAFTRAIRIAYAQWGVVPCGGNVRYSWAPRASWLNAMSSWQTAGRPGERRCRIVFNSRAEFDWPKLCTVAAHEIGHLLGHGHDAVRGTLMSAIYTGPIAACAKPRRPARSAHHRRSHHRASHHRRSRR